MYLFFRHVVPSCCQKMWSKVFLMSWRNQTWVTSRRKVSAKRSMSDVGKLFIVQNVESSMVCWTFLRHYKHVGRTLYHVEYYGTKGIRTKGRNVIWETCDCASIYFLWSGLDRDAVQRFRREYCSEICNIKKLLLMLYYGTGDGNRKTTLRF